MLRDDMIELKKIRDQLQKNTNIMKVAREEFAKKFEELTDVTSKLKETESNVINNINKQALDIYNADPDKKKSIGYGVNIKTVSIMSFDEKEAFAWAQKHKLALMLDAAKFKKLAQVQEIPCVSIDDKDTVTITKNIVIGDSD